MKTRNSGEIVRFKSLQQNHNIQRSSSLFLVKNIFSLLLSLFAVVFSVTYPLQPSQITLISLFTIGIPSFFLALEENDQRIQVNFIMNVFRKAIPGGLTDMLVVGTLVICGYFLKLSSTDISTTATLLLIAVGFMVLYKISSPMNRFRKVLFLLCLIGMLFSGVFLDKVFSLSSISGTSLLLLSILFFAAESLFRLLTKISELVSQHFQGNVTTTMKDSKKPLKETQISDKRKSNLKKVCKNPIQTINNKLTTIRKRVKLMYQSIFHL